MFARMAVIALFLLATPPATAFNTCGSYAEIKKSLKTQFMEIPLLSGWNRAGTFLYEFWTGKPNTWTFIRTEYKHGEISCINYPECTCIVALGDDVALITKHLKALDNGI